MKFRGIIIIAILIGGFYAMGESYDEYRVKKFAEVLQSPDTKFDTLLFTTPSSLATKQKTWFVDEESEIESLLIFLEDYELRKLQPEEINLDDDIDKFSISLEDDKGHLITIMIDENLIIKDSLLYYEIVDTPLDIEWLVQFFIQNQI